MRYHELALQYWLNKAFTLRWGVPVPVVFTSPMDAFSLFSKLWSEANNPFQYLLNVKDEQGIPLYQPYPQPVRYPVMSVYRKGWKLRQYQNFSIHRLRHINYPTVSSGKIENNFGLNMICFRKKLRCKTGLTSGQKSKLLVYFGFFKV